MLGDLLNPIMHVNALGNMAYSMLLMQSSFLKKNSAIQTSLTSGLQPNMLKTLLYILKACNLIHLCNAISPE